MRHRSIAVALAALASLILASVAVAGGWAQVTAKSLPVDPPAGEETTVELAVAQHGVTPVSWPDLTVIATNEASGDVVRVNARGAGPTGSYVATIVFPSAGEWLLTFESTDLVMEGRIALQVAASVPAAPAGAGAPNESAAPVAPVVDVVAAVILLLVVAVALGTVALGARRRSAAAGARASART